MPTARRWTRAVTLSITVAMLLTWSGVSWAAPGNGYATADQTEELWNRLPERLVSWLTGFVPGFAVEAPDHAVRAAKDRGDRAGKPDPGSWLCSECTLEGPHSDPDG